MSLSLQTLVVAIGELNCFFEQRVHKTLLNDSLAFWSDTILHPSRKPGLPRRLKMDITILATASGKEFFGGTEVDVCRTLSR